MAGRSRLGLSALASSARSFRLDDSDERKEESEDDDDPGEPSRAARKTVRWMLPSPSTTGSGGHYFLGVDTPAEPEAASAPPSPPPTLWHRRHLGLLVSIAMASLLTSWLKRGVLSLMKRELHLRAYQQDAAEILLMLPWSCSLLIGLLSDVFPIRGSRWKAYMVLGWSLASLGMLGMSLLEHFQAAESSSSGSGEEDASERVVNAYVFFLGVSCFGEITSVIVAEAFAIALAKREALSSRGQVVASFLLLQLSSEAVGQLGVYETLWEHRVSALTLRVLTHALFVYSLVPIPVLLWWFNDDLGGGEGGCCGRSKTRQPAPQAPSSEPTCCEVPARSDSVDFGELATVSTATTRRSFPELRDGSINDRSSRSRTATATTVTIATASSRNVPSTIELSIADDDNDLSVRGDVEATSGAQSVAQRVLEVLRTVFIKIKTQWLTLWRVLSTRASWGLFRFLCLFIFFSEFALKYAHLVLDDWSGVTGATDAETDVAAEFMYALAVVVWRFAFMNRSWKALASLALLLVYLLPQLVYYSLVILEPSLRGGATGSTLVYSLVKALRGFLRGTVLVLEIAGIVELAPAGAEGVVLGALASVATIMRLVSATFSNMIGYLFGTQVLLARTTSGGSGSSGESTTYDYQADEKWIVFMALMLCLTVRLLAVTGVLCLPRDKKTMSELATGSEAAALASRAYPWWVLGILGTALAVATTLNTFVVTPETWCRRAFGGSGCKAT